MSGLLWTGCLGPVLGCLPLWVTKGNSIRHLLCARHHVLTGQVAFFLSWGSRVRDGVGVRGLTQGASGEAGRSRARLEGVSVYPVPGSPGGGQLPGARQPHLGVGTRQPLNSSSQAPGSSLQGRTPGWRTDLAWGTSQHSRWSPVWAERRGGTLVLPLTCTPTCPQVLGQHVLPGPHRACVGDPLLMGAHGPPLPGVESAPGPIGRPGLGHGGQLAGRAAGT